jgi:hypothetical protein
VAISGLDLTIGPASANTLTLGSGRDPCRVDGRNSGRSCRDRRPGSVTWMSAASGLDEPKETL